MQLTRGTEIYYGGDICNRNGFGKIARVIPATKWGGPDVRIIMRDLRIMRIPVSSFSEVYSGHGGTRFVTKAAYDTWRENYIAESKAEMERLGLL